MADKFIWYELMTTDQDSAVDFYKAVVGWTAADHANSQMGDFRYVIVSAEGRGVGGVMQLSEAMRSGGARPGWVGYVSATDADSRAAQVESSGGRILMGPGDIPGVGRFAMVADPGGAPFYLLAPLPRGDEPPAADPQAPGLVSWHELYSSLGDKAAFDFYSGLFGWETIHEMDMGPMGTYRIFGADGVQMGGMMSKPDNIPSSTWGFYVNVDSLDSAVERVKAGGGEILNGPMDVPGGSWIVQCRDPQGASFNLVSTRR
jgi:predicted enzyme related to lactoylglutathione lyase